MNSKKSLLALASMAAFLSLGYAADKPKTFALVPKSISVPFYADVEKGCKEEAEKLGVKLLYTGPNTPDEAEQVQILRDVVARGVQRLGHRSDERGLRNRGDCRCAQEGHSGDHV